MQCVYFGFLAAFVALGNAGPIQLRGGQDQTTCAKTCTDTNKFNYTPGIIYQYDYTATTSNRVNGASNTEPTMEITAKVGIEPVSKCDLIMRITDVKLLNAEDVSQSTRFSEALSARSLRFSFQDGKIEEICPMTGESTWALNMKRGILSAFQNSMDNLDRDVSISETDVVGSCLTKYTVEDNNGRTRTVVKTKDLLSCNNRESYRVAMQSVRYNVPSKVKSLPLLKSKYECRQTLAISSNALQISECTEEHVFRPFSNGQSGAMTRQKQVLRFTTIRRAGRAATEGFSYRTNLLFQHEDGTMNQRDTEQSILSNLLGFCQKMVKDIRPELPAMMNQLIDNIRNADSDTLRRTYNTISRGSFCQNNGERTKKYFLDAIPMAGTTASVKLIQDLISRKHVTGPEAQMWLLSLSFIQHPSRDMVAAIMPLLDDGDVSGNTILAISSLASSYCSMNPKCGNDNEIDTMINKLLRFIGNCDRADDSKMIYALRALGNIGHSTQAVSRLSQCFTKQSNPMEIRISAINAFRRIPCEATSSDLMGVFLDVTEDAELRINAYIGLMRCPSRMLLMDVRNMLERETSNQVGSFVWSHLTNLMETSDPHLQEIRSILEDENLKKEFNLDNRKFSRNYEGSFFFESLNAGAKMDSNVIFSSKSFIPRSANLNLTIDLFGHAVNILEVGGRVEGLEQLLEKRFSPYKTSNYPSSANMDKIAAAVYMRIFGNELYYNNKIASNPMTLFNKDGSSLLKNAQLVDSRMTVPTCVGLPLNLTVTSTGGIDYEVVKGSANGRFTAKLKLSAAIEVKGEMSVDAHVTKTGLKMVTRAYTTTGVELETYKKRAEIRFPNKKTEFINLETEFYTIHGDNEKKQDLIKDNVHQSKICSGQTMTTLTGLKFCQELRYVNASSHEDAPFFPFTGPFSYDLSMMNEDAPNNYVLEFHFPGPNGYMSIDTPGSQIGRKTMFTLQGDTFSLVTPWRGLKLEGTLINSVAVKSFAGLVSLDNKEYKMLGRLEMDSSKNVFKFTPTFKISSPKHKLSMKGKLDYVNKKSLDIDASITGSMIEPITLKVSSQNVPKGMAATSVLKMGKDEYSAIARLGKPPQKYGFKYSPYLKLTMLGKDKLELQSSVNYDGKSKGALMFKLDKLFFKSIYFNAITAINVGKKKNKHITRITFKSPKGNFKVNGDMENRAAGVISRVIASYKFGIKYSDRLTLSSKIRTLKTKNSIISSGSADLISKQINWLGFNLKGKLTQATNHLDTNFDLYYGNPKNKATNNLKFDTVINYKIKPIAREYNFAMSVKHPGQNINFQVSADHFHTDTWPMRKIDNNIMLQISPKCVTKTGLFYSNVKVKGLQNTDVKVSLAYPGRKMEFEEKIIQLANKAYENLISVQWQTGRIATLKSMFKYTPQLLTVENALGFPNNGKAKLATTVKMDERDYKASLDLHADKYTFTDQTIDYKAKSSLKYAEDKNKISGDAMFELELAPSRKISATVSYVNVIEEKVNSNFNIKTPFKTLESYSDSIEEILSKKQYSYSRNVQWKSNGNQNQMKIDTKYNVYAKEFDYSMHSMYNRMTSDIKMSLKNSDNKKSALFTVQQNKQTLISVKMDRTNDRRQVTTDASLMFDMYDASGNMKVAMLNDDRETTSSGDFQFKLPRCRVNDISGSYSLKHNQAVCSIKLGYTSSLRYYRNGKISAVLIKNLPRNLKANVFVTHNNRELWKIDADYTGSKENFDVNTQVIGPDGKKITASFNLNMSGTRKTSHAEIKSGSIDASVDGAVEFQAGRYFDTELRIGSGGKNLLLSGNYKIESSKHKMIANLGLPDSRQIKAQASFNNAAKKSFSFNVDSPDFPSLTTIDMDLSFQPDVVNSMAQASVRVLPYLEKTQLKASLTRDKITEASIELETPFDTIREAKAILTLDRKRSTINLKTYLNSKKFFTFKSLYNVRNINDFNVKISSSTSHRMYDEFSFDITHKGNWENLDSSVEMKVAKEFVLNANIKNNARHTEISSKISLRDYDDWETQFVRNGYFDDMTINLSHKIGQRDQYTAEMTINGYGRQNTLQLVAPRGVKFDADMTIDPTNINFNLEAFLQSGQRGNYKLMANYNHMSKIDLKLSSPSYNGELMMTLSGTLESFKYKADLTHYYDKYEFTLSNRDYYRQIKATLMAPSLKDSLDFSLNGRWDMFQMILDAKHNNDVYQVKASNKQYYKKMNFDLTAPRFETHIQLDNRNIRNLNGMLNILIKNVKYELAYSNKEYYEEIKLTMSIPKHNLVVKSNADAMKTGMRGDASIIYNGKKVTLDGSYKVVGQKRIIKAELKTPYFNDDLTFSISGKPKKFKVVAKLQHNKDMYELVASNKGYYKTLDINLYLPGWKAKLDFEGELQKFKAFTSMTIGKKQYKLVLSNQNYLKGINVEVTTPSLGNLELRFDFGGDLRNFYLNNQIVWRQTEYSLSTSVNVDTHSYSLSIVLPLFIFKGNMMNIFRSSHFETRVVFDHGTYELAASNDNYLDKVNFNMSTPQLGLQKLTLQLHGKSLFVRLQNNRDVYEYNFSFDKQGFTANFSSSDNKGEMKVKFNDHIKDFIVNVQLVNKGNTYKLKAMNDNYKQISVIVVRPDSDNVDILVDNTGNLKDGKNRVKATFGDYSFDNSGNIQLDKNHFLLQLKPTFRSRRTSAIFNFNLESNFVTKVISQSLDVNINGRKSSIRSKVNLSRGLAASIVLDDPYTSNVELKVNADPMTLNRIKSTVTFDSHLTGHIGLVYEHALTKTSLTSKGYIETGSSGSRSRLVGYNIEVKFQKVYVYKMKTDFNDGRYNVNLHVTISDNMKTSSIQVKTPYRNFRDVIVSTESHTNRMIKVSVTFPRQYYAAMTNWNGNSVNTEVDIHMDRTDKLKQFKIVMSYVNADDIPTVFRRASLKLIQDDIVLTTFFHVKKTYNMYSLKGEFSWGEEDDQKVGAELEIKTAEKKEVSLYLTSPRRNTVVTGSLESGRDRHKVMFALIPDDSKRNEKIEIDADISNYDNKKIFDIDIKLPNQRNSMKLKTIASGPKGDSIFTSRTQFSVDQGARKTLTVETKLNNNNGNYTLDLLVEHPYSNLALGMLAFVRNGQEIFSTGVEVNYMSSKRQQENLRLRADIHKLRRELNIDIMVPKKHIEMSGSVDNDKQFSVTLNKKENGAKNMQATASISRDARSMFVELNYDQANLNKVFHMKGEVMEKKIVLKAYRSTGQQVNNKDGRLSIEMRPSSILLSQIIWNPEILNELNDYSYAVLENFGNEIKLLGDRIVEFVSEEVSVKGNLMQKAFNGHIDIITNFLATEYDFVSRDVAKHARNIGEFYDRDSFYVKSMHMSAIGIWDSMWASYQKDIENFRIRVQIVIRMMSAKLDNAAILINRYYNQFEREYQNYKAEMTRKIDEVFEYIQEQYNNGFQHLNSLQREINLYITRFPVIVKRVHRQIKEYPLAKSVIENGEKIFGTVYQQVSSHPLADSIGNVGSKAYEQAKWAFNYWQVKETLVSMKDKSVNYIRKELDMLADAFTDLNVKTLKFDPKNGEIVVEFHYRSLMMAYKYARSAQRTLESINRSVQKYIDMLPTSYWSIYDIYYTLKPFSDVNNWLPPFQARASVFGSHIQTFDGRHIDFIGTCSHTLAESEGNFKVTVNYSPDKRQHRIDSIFVTTGDNEQVTVNQNYRVRFNGRVIAKLPIMMKDGEIFRDGDKITVSSYSGYTVDINPSAGVYSVHVSGWYFNRVASLLGTYNNEQYDDMTTPNKQYVNDEEDFANSWSVRRSCHSQNHAESHSVPDNAMCTALFRDTTSPFRDCFKQVAPEHFFSVCNSHIYVHGPEDKVQCDLSNYYIEACYFSGVYLPKIESCQRPSKRR